MLAHRLRRCTGINLAMFGVPTKHWTNSVLMLAHHLWCWPRINPPIFGVCSNETSNQCWFNAGPLSMTLAQYWISIVSICLLQPGVPSHYVSKSETLDPALVYCWPTVYDVGPAVNQRWANVSCLLGMWGISHRQTKYRIPDSLFTPNPYLAALCLSVYHKPESKRHLSIFQL